MKYVDGFVVAVPAENKEAYREMAAKAAPLYKEFGALRVVEFNQAGTVDLVQLLQECIDDLKLSIDSLEPLDVQLIEPHQPTPVRGRSALPPQHQ